ncbi:efflux RND transporter permease subunit [Nitratifractor salsuginis]|uniref:Acriflavin resistance protein n=1 Tax=Nitratifractor salsuginis (strain DSM 16511 / JCM 12458 / E9I37-1) TaxID=749222 RepID=E6WZU9_NITSE|nr:acriflavin resistance protein [Nitratifractor salsuginis DSM 16511]
MKRFENFVYNILEHKSKKTLVVLLTLLALAGSVAMLPFKIVKAKMLPGKSDNTFSVYITTPTGSSIDQTYQVGQCVVEELKKEPEITDMEIYAGMGIPLDYAGLVKGSGMKNSENVAEIAVNLTDKHEREITSIEMVHRLRPVVKKACSGVVPGSRIQFVEQPAGPPTLASIVVEVTGHNIPKIRELAAEVAGILKKTPTLVDVDIMEDDIYKKYELIPDKEKIARSGLSVDQVNKIIYLAFEGMAIAHKNSANEPDQIQIFEILDPRTKLFKSKSLDALRRKLNELNLMNKKGMMVPISEVVTIKEVDSKPSIMQKDLHRMINVTAETDEESQVYPLLEARERMIKYFTKKGYKVEKEPGMSTYMFDLHLTDPKTGEKYLLRWDGEMKVTLDTFRDLGGAFIGALVLIFLLLVIYYKNYGLPTIVLIGSFLSIIGVIVGHWVADLVTKDTFFLTATSLIGFIALMGISSRNSLLLIDFAKSLMEARGMPKRRAIAVASATRAKPIMLTAIAIILGSALLASDPIFGGLGVALISGTVAAVFVSLIFVPVLLDNAKSMELDDDNPLHHDPNDISITR